MFFSSSHSHDPWTIEETDTILSHSDDSLPDYETFCFDIEEKSSGSTTSHSNHSLSDYEAFCFDIDHQEEKSSGSTTSHYDISLLEYESFHFDCSIDQLPPAYGIDFYHEEFADELAHIISLPEYDHFYFDLRDNPGELEASEEDEDEEEKHLAPTDSVAATPSPPPRSPRTKIPFSQTRLRRAQKTIRLQPPMAASTEALIVEFASAPTLHHHHHLHYHLGYRAAMIQMRAASPPLVPSPPLLLPFAALRDEVPEADTPLQKRLCLTAPASRAITVVEEVNEKVTDLTTTQRHDAHELHMRDKDVQDDQALMRAEISLLTRERRYFCFVASSYQREAVIARQAWSHSEDRSTDLKASIRKLEAQARDRAHTGDAGPQDGPADAVKNAAKENTTTPMTDAVIKALIAQGVADALAEYEAHRSSGNSDDSHDSGSGRRTERATRECTYSDFLKCQPINFKGTEGVIGLTYALTWWNSHVKTVGHDAAYGMTWETLRKMMTDKYCLRSKLKKLEIKIWNLKVKGSVMASNPKTMQDAIKFATELMDQKIRTFADRQAKNKRKLDDNSRKNQTQQQPFKRQNVARAYTVGPGEKKEYGRSLPLCPKCNYHHNGQCAPRCNNCEKVGHLARDCRGSVVAANNQRALEVNKRVVTCFECEVQGHYKKDCPKLKNNNRGNQAGNGGAITMAYAVGNAGKNSESNVVKGTFLLNNRYDSILFDTGADRSFVSTAFSSLINIVPTTLDHELGSFDVIIGMDWLVKYHAVIICDEKIVHIPFGNEILIFLGDGSNNGHESRLHIISCTKNQKYLLKGYQVFLAHITAKKAEDKSKKKRLEYVPIVRDFPEVFLEDLPGLPPTQQVEFQIDLVCKPYLDEFVIVFIDDILIFLKSKQEHEEHLKLILEFLKKEKFKGIHVDPAKIESIKDWASPNTPTEIRGENFIIYFDALHKGLGVVLMQNDKVIAYAARQLKFHEKNYTTHDLELGSVVDYDCEIRDHPGKEHVVADALSRKERIKPLRVRALVMNIGLDLSKIQAARDHQKSYVDVRRKPLEIQVGDKVMLKVSPWKGVICFGKRGKLNPRYIGLFKVLEKVGTVAYRLELHQQLSRVHSTFHVFNLKKCLSDEPLAIPLDEKHIDDKLYFVEEPAEIIDCEVKQLKQRRIPIIKV
nr:hypothetical protein [Tanacetum cinerariifolium]